MLLTQTAINQYNTFTSSMPCICVWCYICVCIVFYTQHYLSVCHDFCCWPRSIIYAESHSVHLLICELHFGKQKGLYVCSCIAHVMSITQNIYCNIYNIIYIYIIFAVIIMLCSHFSILSHSHLSRVAFSCSRSLSMTGWMPNIRNSYLRWRRNSRLS